MSGLTDRIRALADELEAEFFAYRLEDPVHIRVRALLDDEPTPKGDE